MIQKKALYWETEARGIRCLLCPHQCLIAEGETGICGVRKNLKNTLISLNYGIVSALHIDPVEKKPLYHFFPGSQVLSAGTFGCNFDCLFCQNHELCSQSEKQRSRASYTHPGLLTGRLKSAGNCIGLAYTYNEPAIWYEYVLEAAKEVKNAGGKNILVSNGYLNPKPLQQLLPFTDAFNIDLKGFSEKFYHQYTRGSLKEVKETIRQVARSNTHLELTSLIIPGANDSAEEMKAQVNWIRNECGEDCVLHLNRYFPRHKATAPPTPPDTLKELYDIAREKLHFVYLGNLHTSEGRDTHCPDCQALVSRREGYLLQHKNCTAEGLCSVCGRIIYRHF